MKLIKRTSQIIYWLFPCCFICGLLLGLIEIKSIITFFKYCCITVILSASVSCSGQNKNIIYLNVIDFGATVNNDSDDDWLAIQNAVDSAFHHENMRVFYPCGTYSVSKYISLDFTKYDRKEKLFAPISDSCSLLKISIKQTQK